MHLLLIVDMSTATTATTTRFRSRQRAVARPLADAMSQLRSTARSMMPIIGVYVKQLAGWQNFIAAYQRLSLLAFETLIIAAATEGKGPK